MCTVRLEKYRNREPVGRFHSEKEMGNEPLFVPVSGRRMGTGKKEWVC